MLAFNVQEAGFRWAGAVCPTWHSGNGNSLLMLALMSRRLGSAGRGRSVPRGSPETETVGERVRGGLPARVFDTREADV